MVETNEEKNKAYNQASPSLDIDLKTKKQMEKNEKKIQL